MSKLMSIATLNTLLGYYVMTEILNIVVAAYQFYSKRDRVHLTILLYWIGLFISSVMNVFLTEIQFFGLFVLVTGTFVSQIILGDFFTRLHQVSFPWKKLTAFFILCMGISYMMPLFGFTLEKDFTICMTPVGYAAVIPLVVGCYRTWKYKKSPFTSIQKMFVFVAFLMTLHYLDWPYVRPRPELFTIGLTVAVFLLNFQSILTPMMANEFSLQSRMQDLENEVNDRVQQLTQVKRQLWDANKFASIGRMAGGIAHEINNPLSIISMCTENLLDQAERKSLDPVKTIKDTKLINDALNRISTVTSNLRKVARDHREIEKKEYRFIEIINETLSFSKDRLAQHSVNLEFIPLANNPYVVCNPVEISQVLLNLLNNAIDAVENEPVKEIRIAIEQKNKNLLLIVEDSGKMNPAILPQIMDPFFTTKPFGQATGLGLSISKSIIEAHGGNISVDLSSGKTRFTIELAATFKAEHQKVNV